MDKKALLKSIPEGEERLLFAEALDQAYFCMKRREPAFTDFMDRAKCGRFAERLRNVGEFRTVLFGGMEDCERLMLGFCAPEEELLPEQFPICAIRIRRKNKKFGQSGLSHRDYLGSLLGLGIDRGKLGDILVSEDEAVCFAAAEIVPYICTTLEQVSKTAVVAEECEADGAEFAKKTETKRITVASLRLDAVAGEVFHLSRAKVQGLIGAEKAAVNWAAVTNASHLLKAGDTVSLRGFGRFRVGEAGGRTKKDKLVLEIEQYV